MTVPSPNGSQPAQSTESAIAAGMAAGDTDAVMRAVATSDVVVPQAAGPDGGSRRLDLAAGDRAGRHVVRAGLHLGGDDGRRRTGHRRRRVRVRLRAGGELAVRRPVAGREPRHRGRPDPPAGRRPVAARSTPTAPA